MNKSAIIAGLNAAAMWGICLLAAPVDPVSSGVCAVLAAMNSLAFIVYLSDA